MLTSTVHNYGNMMLGVWSVILGEDLGGPTLEAQDTCCLWHGSLKTNAVAIFAFAFLPEKQKSLL